MSDTPRPDVVKCLEIYDFEHSRIVLFGPDFSVLRSTQYTPETFPIVRLKGAEDAPWIAQEQFIPRAEIDRDAK